MTPHDAQPATKPVFAFISAPSLRRGSSFNVVRDAIATARRGWQWLALHKAARMDHGRLRVTDRISVGEKSYVCVVEVDGQRFLIGGAQATLSLLAELNAVERIPEASKASTKGTKPRSRRKIVNTEGTQEGRL